MMIKKSTAKILVFEEPTVDLILKLKEIPQVGSDVMTDMFYMGPGGSTNFSIMAKRLGLSPKILSYIGTDIFGKLIEKTLEQEKISTDALIKKDGRTTLCITLVDKTSERTFITAPGVGKTFSTADLDLVKITDFDFVYLSGYSLSREAVKTSAIKLLENAIQHNIPIMFDPGTAVFYVDLDLIKRIISSSTFVFLNVMEARKITGFDTVTLAGKELVTDGKKEVVVIKLGREGSMIFTKHASRFVEPFKVNAVDSTGAGDAFNAAFIYAYLKSHDIRIAGQFANLVGALSVTRYGAGPNLPTISEIKNEAAKRNLSWILELLA